MSSARTKTKSTAKKKPSIAPVASDETPLLGALFDGDVLAHEHAKLMQAHHRPVHWEQTTAAAVPSHVREALASLWHGIAESEHRSSGIFATYVLDLMGAGAPNEVLSLACRATLDEVRHAELAARLSAVYSGETPPTFAGIPHVPDDPKLTVWEQSLRQALFLSVGAETFSAMSLAASLEQARDPVVREVLSVILSDEVHHARLGWGYLRYLLQSPQSEKTRAFVGAHLVAVFDELHGSLFGKPSELPPASLTGKDGALAREHGYLPAREHYGLFHSGLTELWVPALARLGFDAKALATRYPAEPWKTRG